MSQDQFLPSFEGTWARLSQVAVNGAEYNSRERQPHPKCLEGTRVDLLNYIHDSLDDQEKNRLIWLHGTAGVGKSAVAFTVAERMRGLKVTEQTYVEKRLAGTFFFSRKHTKRCTTGYFFATLVYQLATNFPSIRKDVNRAIRDNPALLDPDKALCDQMEALFLQPLRNLRLRLRGCQPLSFVIDALDECTSQPELTDLILSLAQALREPDIPVTHILLTSRSESHIRKAFQNAKVQPLLCEIPVKTSGDGIGSIISLDGADVDNDIYLFLQHSFGELGSRHPDFPQPSRDQLAQLAIRAGRRFIVASTMMKFIIDDEDHDPRDRLQLMLELTSELLPGTEVYKLYDSILSTCTNPKRAFLHLSIVASLADPLSMLQISKLLGPGLGRDVETTLVQLRSVLGIPTDTSLPVNIYHSSIRDYVSNPSNCSLPQVQDMQSPHSLLADSSLRLMMKEIPESTALLDALSELHKQSQAMTPDDPHRLKDSLSFLVKPPEPLSVLIGMIWLRGDGGSDLRSWIDTLDGRAWLRTQGGKDWLQKEGGQDWLQTQGGIYWLQTQGGKDWLQKAGGKDWLQTQGGKDWLQTRQGKDWQRTQNYGLQIAFDVKRLLSLVDLGGSPPVCERGRDGLKTLDSLKEGKEWLETVDGCVWLQTEEGHNWLETLVGRVWLQMQRGQEWLQIPGGQEWLQTRSGRDWLQIRSGRDWLRTQGGRDWLRTRGGREWLRTPCGWAWLETPGMRAWLEAPGIRACLQTPRGRAWLETPRGRAWLETPPVRDWLQSPGGRVWLQIPRGEDWLETRAGIDWLRTQRGQDWLQTQRQREREPLQIPRKRAWLQTQSGRDWLQTQSGRDWLQTQSGRDWLKTERGQDWLQTQRGKDWLQTQSGRGRPRDSGGRVWLRTRRGQDWLYTEGGKDWLRTHRGKEWLQTEHGRRWLLAQGGQHWLKTEGGLDWLQTQRGHDWLHTKGGEDWLQTLGMRTWLQTQGGQDWLQTPRARDWLQTLCGREWLQTPHGQAWQSTPAASVWVTMEEFSSTLQAMNDYTIVPELLSLSAFRAVQQFKSLPDFLMFPMFLALMHQDHSASTSPEDLFSSGREIIHAMNAFTTFANDAREQSRSASDALKYACQNWAIHLSRAPNHKLDHVFQAFWTRHLLSWLEMQWCLKGLQSCLNVLSQGQKLTRVDIINS
ncbi:hypothetical protein DEU56DRAFT_977589 [Suillus clintonianus]|uniref:uncharacterized protein n=1 Tax=Suillus clintonianus TaxID=1904413 RepID=UPI001B8705F0|nr:uncharacterized protein DEU56DRAFT_977589 [Suillus clintonianus]KAG2150892.1 hypothetical protein DEU56DRAFT_977589 [Suillus clintonianus]